MKNPSFRFVLAACSLASAWLSAADGPQFRSRPLQAGRASLASGGFTLQRTFGTANFTPELAWPVLISCTSTCHADGQLATATRTGGPRSVAAATSNPDGWNQMAYCGNEIITHVDYLGAVDINLFPEDEDIHNSADNYNDPNYITVGAHGNSDGIYDQDDNDVPVSQLAQDIRELPKFDQVGLKGIILASCNVGLGSYAQDLADVVHMPVWAPSEYAWYSPNGTVEYYGKDPITKKPD